MKDLVEHIRTVHFTVLVVSFVLTAALQIERKRPVERAAADAEAILRLQQRWSETEAQLRKAANVAAERFASTFAGGPPGPTTVLPRRGVYRTQGPTGYPVESVLRFQIVEGWLFTDNRPLTDEKSSLTRFPPPWNTLQEFLTFWDGLHKELTAFLPIVLAPPADSSFCNSIERIRDTSLTAYLVVVPARDVSAEWSIVPKLRFATGMGFGAQACDLQKVIVKPLKLDLGRVFSPVTAQASSWGTDESTKEFPELIAAAKYFEDSPLERLAAALRERANTDTERIELFQAKLPADSIPTYGTIVLLLCQFYLFAHLVELREVSAGSRDPDLPLAYIGLYKSRLVFVFTVLSIAALPVLPLALAIGPATGDLRHILAIAIIGSTAIGVASAVVLWAMRVRRFAPPPAPSSGPATSGAGDTQSSPS